MLAVMQGQALGLANGVNSFTDVERMFAILGDNLVFKGYPRESGSSGSALQMQGTVAMGSKSAHKDGVWRFISSLLTAERAAANPNTQWSFPANQAEFDKLAEIAMTDYHEGDEPTTVTYNTYGGSSWSDGRSFPENSGKPVIAKSTIEFENSGLPVIEVFALKRADFDKFVNFLNTISTTTEIDLKLSEMIAAELEPFFAGQKSAQQVLDLVQSKVDIYVNEQR
jgi:ABC-type glycerol-3-phosphate transport system substrate-binding protein